MVLCLLLNVNGEDSQSWAGCREHCTYLLTELGGGRGASALRWHSQASFFALPALSFDICLLSPHISFLTLKKILFQANLRAAVVIWIKTMTCKMDLVQSQELLFLYDFSFIWQF